MASKKETLIAELNALEVKLTGDETTAELQELLAKAETHDEDAGGGEPEDDDTAKTDGNSDDKDESSDKDSVNVGFIDPNLGQTIRVFSKKVHGKDFQKIAKDFVKTHADKSAVIED